MLSSWFVEWWMGTESYADRNAAMTFLEVADLLRPLVEQAPTGVASAGTRVGPGRSRQCAQLDRTMPSSSSWRRRRYRLATSRLSSPTCGDEAILEVVAVARPGSEREQHHRFDEALDPRPDRPAARRSEPATA